MAPSSSLPLIGRAAKPTRASMSVEADIVEAWAEGFQVGGLIILILIVLCNLRRHVLLHKLILLEQFLALWKGVVIFFPDPSYGWYLSSTVILLYISYFLHNYISWMKIRPFLEKKSSIIYLGTLILVQPYWAVAVWTNYEKFNGMGDQDYRRIRPWETFAREPWWIFTTCYLVYVLKTRFDYGLVELIRLSPRFGVMIFCMLMSVAFLVADFVSVFANLHHANGLNPFWRLALVFKCASDTIFLDDFKRVFEALGVNAINKAVGTEHARLASESRVSSAKPSMSTNHRQNSASIFSRASISHPLRRKSSNDGNAVDIEASPSSPSAPPSSYEMGKRHSCRSQSTNETDLAISIAK